MWSTFNTWAINDPFLIMLLFVVFLGLVVVVVLDLCFLWTGNIKYFLRKHEFISWFAAYLNLVLTVAWMLLNLGFCLVDLLGSLDLGHLSFSHVAHCQDYDSDSGSSEATRSVANPQHYSNEYPPKNTQEDFQEDFQEHYFLENNSVAGSEGSDISSVSSNNSLDATPYSLGRGNIFINNALRHHIRNSVQGQAYQDYLDSLDNDPEN